jgi:hypothetical protein
MATGNPPTENLPIVNGSVFGTTSEYLTESQANSLYLQYPISQGSETVTGTLTASANVELDGNIVMNGISNINYLEFPDGTQQFTANSVGTGNVTVQENLLFPNAGSYILFPDGTKQYSAYGSTAILATYNYVPYNVTTPTVTTYNLVPNGQKTILSGVAVKSFTLCLAGGGGNNGANDTSGSTHYYGGSGGAGSAITCGTSYTAAQTTSVGVVNIFLYPDVRPSSLLLNASTPSILWGGSLSVTSGGTIMNYVGSLSTYTQANFNTAVVGQIVYCKLYNNYNKPYFITAWIFAKGTNSITTGIVALEAYNGLATPTTTSPTLFYIYNNSTQYTGAGTGILPVTTGVVTYVTCTFTYGTVSVGDVIAFYSSSKVIAFYSYVASIAGSVITLANPYTLVGIWATSLVFYCVTPQNGETYACTFPTNAQLGVSGATLGITYGGNVGTSATSSAFGNSGIGGVATLNSTLAITSAVASGGSGSVGYSNVSPWTSGSTTQTYNSLVSASNVSDTALPYSFGGYTVSGTGGVNTTYSGGVGCTVLQLYG